MQESEWENRYQIGQTGWDRGTSSENLSFWLDNNLLDKGKILIPGCGNGYEVLRLAELGFDVTAIDIAMTPIQNLQSALDKAGLSATLVKSDFFKWKVENQFDAIFEQTSLCALPPEQWQLYVNKLASWLKPGGKLFVHFLQKTKPGGPPYHCEIREMHKLFNDEQWLWSAEYFTNRNEIKNIAEIAYLLVKK